MGAGVDDNCMGKMPQADTLITWVWVRAPPNTMYGLDCLRTITLSEG